MLQNLAFYLTLVIVIVLLIMLAQKIKVAYPVLLVLAGLGISFIPGIPIVEIEPELIFFIFLPPLLYEAAWNSSWKELWRWRRIVFSFAFVVVFFYCNCGRFCCKLSYSWIFFGVRFLVRRNRISTRCGECRRYFKVCKNPEKIPIYFRRRKFVE